MSGSEAAEAIPEATRKRIHAAAQQLGYRPHHVARSLRNSRSMSIGIMAPEFSDGYFTLLMAGAESYLLSQEYFYFTVSHYWKPALLEQYPLMLEERGVDGLLLLNTPTPKTSLPMIAVSGHASKASPTTVMLNHQKAAQLILEHLYQLGHRKIAVMRGQSWSQDSDTRWLELLKAAKKLSIPINPKLQIVLRSFSWAADLGYNPIQELLQRTRDFSALICFNDISAMGAIRSLRDAGLRVPQDVSVVGFDDISNASFFSPSLTTVHQPLHEMGHAAAELLIERLNHPSKKAAKHILYEPTLIARESTGPAPTPTTRKTIK